MLRPGQGTSDDDHHQDDAGDPERRAHGSMALAVVMGQESRGARPHQGGSTGAPSELGVSPLVQRLLVGGRRGVPRMAHCGE
jgi:hypothetical protein